MFAQPFLESRGTSSASPMPNRWSSMGSADDQLFNPGGRGLSTPSPSPSIRMHSQQSFTPGSASVPHTPGQSFSSSRHTGHQTRGQNAAVSDSGFQFKAPTASLSAAKRSWTRGQAMGMFSGGPLQNASHEPTGSFSLSMPSDGGANAFTFGANTAGSSRTVQDSMREPPTANVSSLSPSAQELGPSASSLSVPTTFQAPAPADDLKFWVTIFGFPPDLSQYILNKFGEYGKISESQFPPSVTNYVHVRYSNEFEAQKVVAQRFKKLTDGLVVGMIPCIDRSVVTGPTRPAALPPPSSSERPAVPGTPDGRLGPDERPRKRMRTDWWSRGWDAVMSLLA
uniref:RRM Nup35-type domain-containing protein n=1 Tax=Eutreptiella gymnastica TaxID=73025 RepID=A0A7S4G7Z0_9EUGL